MGLFNRKKSDTPSDEPPKEKGAWRKPGNTAFKQQRLKAWQPILTPKTVLPTLFLIGVVFGPIGGLLVWGSSQVSELTFDYSDCINVDSSPADDLTFHQIPGDKYSYHMRSADSDATYLKPQYAFIDNSANTSIDIASRQQCILEFDVPAELQSPVFFYYKLTNFYQNHRRYVNSLDTDQLKGKVVSVDDLNSGDCDPLGTLGGKPVYPCGLIANSLFNDSFTSLTLAKDANTGYDFSYKGIAWPGESKKYVSDPVTDGDYDNYTQFVPPPNWARYNGSYSEDNPPPNLKTDEHFQNWMRTAGLPTFTKLYGRNDHDNLPKGTYRVTIDMNFPVLPYKGTKSIVISTVSWIGGKNPFLGWAYVATAGLFVFLALAGTARHLIRPRKLGDMSLLSWNKDQ